MMSEPDVVKQDRVTYLKAEIQRFLMDKKLLAKLEEKQASGA
jgi:hypothetical protein